jgi:SAM-dependent methyltransferase
MTQSRHITYVSTPMTVSMADKWFEIATTEHFWIRRRFEVFQKLAGKRVQEATQMMEIGCGNGLLQKQLEVEYGREVTGCDLNEYALQRNVSEKSQLLCYNIFEKTDSLRGKFNLIFMFDVLEHITEEGAFLEAAKFHLAPGGKMILNVPAGQWAFSAYDRAAGHVRRYSIRMMRAVAESQRMKVTDWTYWGLPLLPPLIARKIWLSGETDQDEIISKGFDARSKFVNGCMHALAKCEPIPQKLLGCSLLAVLQS